MPSKKKYNARFPPARIKKIMQTDEEVGKVAAPVPVIISRVLELFVKNLLGKAGEFAANNQARTLLSLHLTQAISSDPRLHFLQETVRQHSKTGDGLDLKRGNAAAEDGDAAASSAIALMQAAPPPPYCHQQSSALVVSSLTAAPAPGSGSFSPRIISSVLEPMPLGAAPAQGATCLPARGRGRGRPRGRPPKRPLPDLTPISSNMTPTAPATKRGRGRPRKYAASPTFVGTDSVTVSSPGLNGPFEPSLAQAQPFFSYPDPQQHLGSPSRIFPGSLTGATSYAIPSMAESAANFSFTVGQAQFGGGSASITCNNSGGSPSSHLEGHALGSPVADNCFQQSVPSSPSSAPMTISRVDGGSRESSPHLSSNGSLAGPGASSCTILTAPPSQSNPLFSGIKIEIPSLPAAQLPFSIHSPYSVSIPPVSPVPTNKCKTELSSSGKKQRQQAPPFGSRRGSSSNSIDTHHLDDSANGKVASGATFTFGGPALGGGLSSASASSDTSSLTSVAINFSTTATSLPMRHLQSASTSNLDEDYDS